MLSTATFFIAALALFSGANAHMKMATPIPFDDANLNNSPLEADGSDFPCKGVMGNPPPTDSGPNHMVIGESQTLSFIGGATHGGGSCQISLTTDKQPTANTEWMVIHSIEGGCPSSADGNLNGDPNSRDSTKFEYQIPDGIAPGDYVLGWTWFNLMGNREMYMNCAPITVSGKNAKRSVSRITKPGFSKRADFPSMFVANIGNGCTTEEGFDVEFPNPGSSVEISPGANLKAPGCGGGAASGSGSTGSSGSSDTSDTSGSSGSSGSSDGSSSGGASVAAPAPSSTGSDSDSVSASPTVAPGVFATGASQPSGGASSPATSSAAAPAPASTGSSSSGTTSGSSSGGMTGPCTSEGDWNCIGGTSFQRCASGQWSAVMPMAAGTKCTPGQSSELSMAKRDSMPLILESRSRVRRSLGAWGN